MIRLAKVFAPAALLAGCTSNSFTDRPANLSYVDDVISSTSAPPAIETERRALKDYHSARDIDRSGMDRRTFRDSIVWREVAADDDSFHKFVRAVRSDRTLMTLSADTGAIFLNGLATVTGTAGEKAALAALSGGLLSTKGAFDKELFNLEAMSALLARMKASRLVALVPIEKGLAQDIQAYPLEKALRDLRMYADAGSLLSTLDAIANDAGTETQKATAEIQAVTRDVIYRDSRGRVDTLRSRLLTLNDVQALAMVFAMEKTKEDRSDELKDDLKSFDPADARFKSGANGRAFLLYWLEQEGGASSELDEWRDALTLAEKG